MSPAPPGLHPRLPLWGATAVWLGWAAIATAIGLLETRGGTEETPFLGVAWTYAGIWLVSAALALPTLRLFQRTAPAGSRHSRQVAAALLTFVVFHLASQAVYVAFELAVVRKVLGLEPSPFGLRFETFVVRRLLLSALTVAIIIGFDAVRRAINERILEQDRSNRLAADLMRARLEALRIQLQPHFLLNTLNAIGAHVRGDPETAETMLERLGELLKASLQAGGASTIPLHQEFALLRAYLTLQQIRFSDRLRYRLELPAELEQALVPPMLLQPLVENAVRHGIEPGHRVGIVTVRARTRDGVLNLEVHDDGAGMPPGVEPSAGLGLTNTRLRVSTFGGPLGSLDVRGAMTGGTVALVRLPLITEMTPP